MDLELNQEKRKYMTRQVKNDKILSWFIQKGNNKTVNIQKVEQFTQLEVQIKKDPGNRE